MPRSYYSRPGCRDSYIQCVDARSFCVVMVRLVSAVPFSLGMSSAPSEVQMHRWRSVRRKYARAQQIPNVTAVCAIFGKMGHKGVTARTVHYTFRRHSCPTRVCGKVLREYPQQGWPEVAPMDLSRPEAFRNGTEALVWPGSGRFEPLIGRRCPFFCCRRQPQAWKLVNGSRAAAKNQSADHHTQKHDAHPGSR